MLTLAVNGIDALRAIGADTAAAAVGEGFPTPPPRRSHTGKRLGVTSTGGALDDGTVAHTIRRADLYQVLHSQERCSFAASSTMMITSAGASRPRPMAGRVWWPLAAARAGGW